MNNLPVPNDVTSDLNAIEVARLWIGNNDLLVSLRIGTYRDPNGPDESTAWGDILADTIRHLAHGISIQSGLDVQTCRDSIVSRLLESLRQVDRPMTGSFSSTSNELPK